MQYILSKPFTIVTGSGLLFCSLVFFLNFAKLSPAQSNFNSLGWAEIALLSLYPSSDPTWPDLTRPEKYVLDQLES